MPRDEYDPADDVDPTTLAGAHPDAIARGYAAGTHAALAAREREEDRQVAAYERWLDRQEKRR